MQAERSVELIGTNRTCGLAYVFTLHLESFPPSYVQLWFSLAPSFRLFAGDHGSLPGMDKTSYSSSGKNTISVRNDTQYTLTLLYSGPDSKRLVLSPRSSGTVYLPNGSYRVAASVAAANVRSYAGTETLTGGSYDVSYYISTSRF